MGSVSEWYQSLDFVDKMLIGIGGLLTAAIGGSLMVVLLAKSDRVTGTRSFTEFKKGVTIASIIWEPLDALLKGKFRDNKYAENVRYGIDQILDLLKGFAMSENLKSLIGG